MKELSLKMERLHEEMTKKRKILDNEVVETMAVQIELDKTAEDFRKAHLEREELINQWEKTIYQMKRRDENMNKCANVRKTDIGGEGVGRDEKYRPNERRDENVNKCANVRKCRHWGGRGGEG